MLLPRPLSHRAMSIFKRFGKKATKQHEDPPPNIHPPVQITPSSTAEPRRSLPSSEPVDVSPSPATGGSIFSGLTFSPAPTSTDEPDETAEPVTSSGFETLEQGGPNDNVSSSGFGFLNQGPVSEVDNSEAEQSSFSFISPSEDHQPPSSEQPTTTEDASSSTQSGFGFLSNSRSLDATSTDSEHVEQQQATICQPVVTSSSPRHSPSPIKQAPSPSLQSSPLSSSPRPNTPQQRVQRQAPPGKAKKIKKKAVRPGQTRPSEPYTGTLVDLTDIPRHSGDQPSSISSESEEQTQPRNDITAEEPDGSLANSEQTHSSSPHKSRQPLEDIVFKHSTISSETHKDKVTQDDSDNSASKTHKIHQPSVITEERSVVTEQPPLVTEQPSLVTDQPSLVTDQPSLVTSVVNEPTTMDKVSDSTDDIQEPDSSERAIVAEEDSQEEERATVNGSANNGTVSSADYTVELSATEKLETMVEAVESDLTAVRLSLAKIDNSYQSSVEEQLKTVRQQIKLRHDVKQLKADEAVALSEENYELAEELNRKMETISIEPEWRIAEKTHKIFNEWVCQCQELLTSEVSLQDKLHQAMSQLKEEQSNALTGLEKELLSSQAKEKAQLQTMVDKLQRERGLIAIDQEHLEKREQLLQDEENHRAAEFLSRREQLEEEHRAGEAEIAGLEAKLRELRDHQRELEQQIDGENEKIQQVADELAVEKQLFDKEKAMIEEKRRKILEDEQTVNESKEKLEAKQKKQNVEIQRTTELVEGYARTLQSCSARKDMLQQSTAQENNLLTEGISHLLKPSAQLNSLIDKEESKDCEVKQQTSEVLTMQSKLSSIHKRIADCEVQLPKLQESKKTAVNARQFREAKKIAEEEKSVSAMMVELKGEIDGLEESLTKMNESLSLLNKELIATRQEREEAEKQHDVECIKKLASSYNSSHSDSSETPFSVILAQCRVLYLLLVEDLCAKQDLLTTDYISNTTASFLPLTEERTPGVGMEKSAKRVSEESNSKRQELTEELRDIETKISEAVELEDYDLAAELDEKQNKLKRELELLEL